MAGPRRPNNWAPILGEWELPSVHEVRFKGRPYVPPDEGADLPSKPPRDPGPHPSYGVVLSDLRFSGGAVEATFTFEESSVAVGEVILAYNPQTREMLTAGVGGGVGRPLFSVRERVRDNEGDRGSHSHWEMLDAAGDGSDLEADKPYHVRGSMSGSRIELTVNGIEVLAAQRRGVVAPNLFPTGILCGSVENVKVSAFCIDAEVPRAFVVTQFSEHFTDVYLEVIKSACKDFGIEAIRADEIYGPGMIVEDIVEQVRTAQLVIADISVENPNVYFEVGYALATRKPIILLAKKGTSLPFDVSGFRVLFYEDTIGGKSRVERGLRNHLRALLGPEAGSISNQSVG